MEKTSVSIRKEEEKEEGCCGGMGTNVMFGYETDKDGNKQQVNCVCKEVVCIYLYIPLCIYTLHIY